MFLLSVVSELDTDRSLQKNANWRGFSNRLQHFCYGTFLQWFSSEPAQLWRHEDWVTLHCRLWEEITWCIIVLSAYSLVSFLLLLQTNYTSGFRLSYLYPHVPYKIPFLAHLPGAEKLAFCENYWACIFVFLYIVMSIIVSGHIINRYSFICRCLHQKACLCCCLHCKSFLSWPVMRSWSIEMVVSCSSLYLHRNIPQIDHWCNVDINHMMGSAPMKKEFVMLKWSMKHGHYKKLSSVFYKNECEWKEDAVNTECIK